MLSVLIPGSLSVGGLFPGNSGGQSLVYSAQKCAGGGLQACAASLSTMMSECAPRDVIGVVCGGKTKKTKKEKSRALY